MRQKTFGSFLFFILCVFILCFGFLKYGPVFLEKFQSNPAQNQKALSSESVSTPSQRGQSASVEVKRTALQKIILKNTYIGTVEPIHEVSLVPFISGFIEKVNVQGGQTVQKGDVLFLIEKSAYVAAKKQAQANVAKAKADLDNAASYLERIRKTKSQAVSKTELEKAQADFSAAQASLKGAQAALSSAQVNLDYTVIKAPITGRLGNIPVTNGNYVSPQSASLGRIIQPSPIRVVFSVPVKEYLTVPKRFRAGEKVGLILPNGRQYDFEGKIAYADNAASVKTSSVKMYADFENKEESLLSGAYVSVEIERETEGFLLPKNLVSLSPDGDFVFLVRDDKVFKQKVKVEAALNNDYVIGENGGLQTGDLIVKGMTSSLTEGEKVKIIRIEDSAFSDFSTLEKSKEEPKEKERSK
jgi:RND family efflux transporter MFP subunit